MENKKIRMIDDFRRSLGLFSLIGKRRVINEEAQICYLRLALSELV